jgi:hypothetical protein
VRLFLSRVGRCFGRGGWVCFSLGSFIHGTASPHYLARDFFSVCRWLAFAELRQKGRFWDEA